MRLSTLNLLQLQVEALFTHDPDGRIRYTNEPGESPAPRFFLGRSSGGNLWRCRYDLPDGVARKLEAHAAAEPVVSDLRAPPVSFDAYRAILREHAEITGEYWGPGYYFPEYIERPANAVLIDHGNVDLLRAFGVDFADVRERLDARAPCAVVVAGGAAVSICFCARITPRAAEAGVETLPEHRGRGYAPAAVAAWALAV